MPSAVTAGVIVAVTSAPPRSTVTDMVSPAGVHGGEKVRRGRDVPAVDAADHVTGQQPRVLGGRGLAAGRVHLGEIRHEHARRRHLNADGPAERHERRRLRRHARAQRERDRRRDGKPAQKMWLFPQKIPPLRVQYQYAGFRTK